MKYLPYLPIAGAVVLAFLISGAEDPERQRVLTGWAAILVGSTLLLLGVRSLITGEARGRTEVVRRDDNPAAFWTAVVLLRFALAAAMFVGGVVYLS